MFQRDARRPSVPAFVLGILLFVPLVANVDTFHVNAEPSECISEHCGQVMDRSQDG